MGFFKSSHARGFTLAEVLVVLSILALLLAVVIANVGEGRKKAHDTERTTELAQIQLGLRLYKDAHGEYPSVSGPETIGEGGSFDAIIAPYIAGGVINDPLMDASDSTYEYVYDDGLTCGGTSVFAIYAKTMERSASSNWSDVCGGAAPGTDTYVVILK